MHPQEVDAKPQFCILCKQDFVVQSKTQFPEIARTWMIKNTTAQQLSYDKQCSFSFFYDKQCSFSRLFKSVDPCLVRSCMSKHVHESINNPYFSARLFLLSRPHTTYALPSRPHFDGENRSDHNNEKLITSSVPLRE